MKHAGIILILALAISARAQVVTVSHPPTPREAGMGFNGTALASGAASAWHNPAALAHTSGLDAFFSYQRPFNLPFFLDLAVGAAHSTNRLGTFAVAAQSMSVRYQDTDLSAERTIGLSHGIYLQKDLHSSLAVGWTVRAMAWSLEPSVDGVSLGSDWALGLDLGVMGTLWDRTRVGGSIRNVNAPSIGAVEKHQLPREVQVGMTYEPYRGVITTLGGHKGLGRELSLQGGLELEVASALKLRAGVFSEPNSFTLGAGFHHRGLGFDYAFVSHPTLQGSHLVSLHVAR
ncbi:MAG: hypothetical protein C4524_01295 [Candidatus Zixiibacteriota bacterium]|nr:MAG: hypothetical protein C4524_01295 [candidate division Zixibacteria bacterium]